MLPPAAYKADPYSDKKVNHKLYGPGQVYEIGVGEVTGVRMYGVIFENGEEKDLPLDEIKEILVKEPASKEAEPEKEAEEPEAAEEQSKEEADEEPEEPSKEEADEKAKNDDAYKDKLRMLQRSLLLK